MGGPQKDQAPLGNKSNLPKKRKGQTSLGDKADLSKKGEAANVAKRSAVDAVKKGVASKAAGGQLKGQIPQVGNKADLSKKGKVANVAKQTAAGAVGKNAAGKAAGGQLSGAVAGAAQGLLEVIPKQWLYAAILVPIAIMFLVWMMIINSITGMIGGQITAQLTASNSASITLSGISQTDMTTIQSSVANTNTPWELLVATLYYESGNGQPVAQDVGRCPSGARPNSVCPAVSTISPSPPQTGSKPGGKPTKGKAPPPNPNSGFNPKVGRNGTVPRFLPKNSPDWTTTNTADWDCIREAESGDNYKVQSGAYGFLQSTWNYYNEPGTPGQASKKTQNALALKILRYEGHFFGAWNDACTGSGGETENPVQYISPGVAYPSGSQSSTSSGNCLTGNGPYCLAASALPAAKANDLATSSTWIANQINNALVSGHADGNLSDGTNLWSANEPPTLNTQTNYGASNNQKVIMAALAKLPIAKNTATLDKNIYEMAVDLSIGYVPPATSGVCTPPTPITGTATIAGPMNGKTPTAVILLPPQTALAQQIVTAAGNTSLNNIEAMLAASLALTQLDNSNGLFGNGDTNVAMSVQKFLFLVTISSASGSPSHVASVVLGLPPSTFSGWVAGATELATADTGTMTACSPKTSIPIVPGGTPQAQAAVRAAEAELGLPYVWGGGGSAGPSGAASTCVNGVVAGGQPGAGNKCTATYATQAGEPGFDCSGLVQYAYAQAGIALPRTSQLQYAWVKQYSTLTTTVSQLVPGDLLFYSFSGLADHVAIYIGGNRMIQAPETGEDVQIVPFYSTDFIGGGPV
ncbi:MAG: C40 family peptidase [Acidimicrobiales bacterium]